MRESKIESEREKQWEQRKFPFQQFRDKEGDKKIEQEHGTANMTKALKATYLWPLFLRPLSHRACYLQLIYQTSSTKPHPFRAAPPTYPRGGLATVNPSWGGLDSMECHRLGCQLLQSLTSWMVLLKNIAKLQGDAKANEVPSRTIKNLAKQLAKKGGPGEVVLQQVVCEPTDLMK